MKTYTGFEYLAIDVANNYGEDKLEFEDRIKLVYSHIENGTLDQLPNDPKADKKTLPLLKKSIMVVDRALRGLPSGYTIGMDATCSGMQILSALTGCVAGANATGLVDPDKRMDAYKVVTDVMNTMEGIRIRIQRKDAKEAVMTSIYGSKKKPMEIFGDDTPELRAFYKAMMIVAPGAWQVLEYLRNAWNAYALYHAWKLPDGYDAKVKVMEKVEKRIEVDELDHATFTHEFFVNEGTKTGISLVANVTHSVDAYVLRTMMRRCNYDAKMVNIANDLIVAEMARRMNGGKQVTLEDGTKFRYYMDQYKRSTVVDVVILPHLTAENVMQMSNTHLAKLGSIIDQMLQHKPFAIITVHDAFHALPDNCNWVRFHYKEILADLADSDLLADLLSQVYGQPGTFDKLSKGLGDVIRKSNYALS